MSFLNRTKELKMVPASSLIPHDKNWRRHPDYQREVLRELMEEVGFAGAILTRETPLGYQIIDGHLRGDLGEDQEVPILVTDLTSEEADKLLAVYDPISTLADADDEAYLALLDSLNWQSNTLQEFVDSVLVEDDGVNELPPNPPEDPGPQLDKADELRQKWGVERGQIWEISSSTTKGKSHRLMCGDSTTENDVSELLQGSAALYGMHDPPYGIDVVGGSKPFGSVGGSNVVSVGVYEPIHGDDEPFDPSIILKVCPDSILWGANYYASLLPCRKGWLVWDKKGRDWQDNFSDCELAWTPFSITTRIYRYVWMGMVQQGEREERQHPTQKPSKLFAQIMNDLFVESRPVVDFYLGSGTTMVAAEQTGRICFGMEISEKYVAVSLERMSLMGLVPRLLS